MEIEILTNSNTVIWRPQGELEEPTQLKIPMEEFKSSGQQTLLLDLTEREWLSSSEIGVAMWIFKELDSVGLDLCLLATSPFVLKTIKVTGIDQLLPIFESREEALNKF